MTTLPATPVLSFDEQLRHIADRSAALRIAAAAAGQDARVPSCPDWSVADLVAHLGEVHLFWTAVVSAGPASGPPDESLIGDRTPHGDLLDWSASATASLIGALRAAGPDRGCWTWWESAGAPMTAGAVARHQVQEAAVHALDAQLAAGQAQALPHAVAADGVGEHLTVELPTNGAWPHDPEQLVLDAGDGGIWLVDLGRTGARVSALASPGDTAGAGPAATVSAAPEDFVLVFYRRPGSGEMHVSGDAKAFQRLLDWPNLD
jgi:uncharacterized protein (TIGR03083 family)